MLHGRPHEGILGTAIQPLCPQGLLLCRVQALDMYLASRRTCVAGTLRALMGKKAATVADVSRSLCTCAAQLQVGILLVLPTIGHVQCCLVPSLSQVSCAVFLPMIQSLELPPQVLSWAGQLMRMRYGVLMKISSDSHTYRTQAILLSSSAPVN